MINSWTRSHFQTVLHSSKQTRSLFISRLPAVLWSTAATSPLVCNTFASHVALDAGHYFSMKTVRSRILFVPVPVTSSLMGNYFRPIAEAMLLHQPRIDWLPIVLSFRKHFKVRFPCLNNGLQSHEKRLRGKIKGWDRSYWRGPFSGDERGGGNAFHTSLQRVRWIWDAQMATYSVCLSTPLTFFSVHVCSHASLCLYPEARGQTTPRFTGF